MAADSTSPTDRAIARAQDALRADPNDTDAQLDLALAFVQKARETADPLLYTSADALLVLVAEVAPDDVRVLTAQGSLALSRHRFTEALALGERALAAAPGNETAYGVMVDALNELGRYDDALEATQAMADVRPGLAALSRVSYARELRGDLDGAIQAMSQAAVAGASTGGENLAFVRVLLGNLLLLRSDAAQAEEQYDLADAAFPDLPATSAGRARLLVAQGRPAEAADLLGALVETQPLIEYAIAHGDALTAADRIDEADDAYALVAAIADLQEANGVEIDVDLALFDAERDPGDDAVERARRGLEQRPSIIGHDALAWNLYRAGSIDEATTAAEAALATGTRDPAIRFHAAAIAMAAGDEAAARGHLEVVLASNPRFSPTSAGEVAELAGDLGLEVPPPLAS